jgi:predicted dehydrogenase
MSAVKVGIIGCGNISGAYLRASQMFEVFDIVAVSDLVLERAQAKAEEFNVPKACTVSDLLADPEIDIIINLTIPKVHAQVSLDILNAGKHVYLEKPLAVHLEDGIKVIEMAKEKGLRVGCAPDTFLGGGIQTCRKLIDDGWIGEPIAATAFMLGHGPEGWHPDPEFFYQGGGGPMFDMGPYYVTALINLIGPIAQVTGSTRITFPERTIYSKTKYGQKMKVEIPTHVAGLLNFSNGAVGTIITSFDVWGAQLPRIEIYGTNGSLSVPDPNTFGGPVKIKQQHDSEWREVPLTHSFTENSRGIGVADMAYAIRHNRPHRVSGNLALHALEVMHGIHTASDKGQHVTLQHLCERPEALPTGFSLHTVNDINK